MKEYGLTHDEAFVQFVYFENYEGRLKLITEAGEESIVALRDNLRKTEKSNIK